MRIRVKYIIVVLVCAALAACSDKSYNGIAPDGTSVYFEDERMPVLISVGIPDNIVSKGSGALDYDTEDPWSDRDIYVYAFKRDLNTSFTHLSRDNSRNCLIDGSNDGQNNPAGKMARKNPLDIYFSWTGIERKVVYPEGYEPYDFYAYFLDDIQPSPEDYTRTDDAVTVNVTIDGTQDLMSSVAALTDEQLYNDQYTDAERVDLQNYSFSSYSAKRNVHPTFIFKHHLSRLRFALYPGREEANNIYVDSLKVYSKTKGVFTVAHKSSGNMGVDFSEDAEYKELWLTEADGSPLKLETYHTDYSGSFDGGVFTRDAYYVGGSVLAAPDEYYRAVIYLKEYMEDGTIFRSEQPLDLELAAGFSPGMQYTVRIAVYGILEISTSVQVTPWEYGGNIVVDEDQL